MAFMRFSGGAALACALLAACNQGSRDGSDQNQAEANEVQLPLPPKPVAQAPLDRAALLTAVARAGSAFALGEDDSTVQRNLDGQQFEFRMRFGCDAVPRPDSPFSVSFDEKARTLRLAAAPTVSLEDPEVAATSHDQIEAVEGFWIDRPWLLAAACPKQPAQPVEAPAPDAEADPQAKPLAVHPPPTSRIGIAQFFAADESRMMRRNSRAYQVTKALPEETAPSAAGYDIVLAGRLKKMEDGRVIACVAGPAGGAPSCIVSASFDRVSIRRGDNDELLAEWGSG